MKNCSIQGCPGEYELRAITHTVRQGKRVVVVDHVPAEVCGVGSLSKTDLEYLFAKD